ncbi:Methyltransferase domain-containing protein [Tistlia consotensis]|uniref:Methyltransferase domain-containing protein n=1 Tax=Tistlia consotensis USBA 355 TaxID=560819 RepID=A0A1Y6CRE4_9PROT|nr:class I SAM-dependent methyltransferase [Tistlia consotensis]SMF73524.1 Methyltransferase domain-containing protein [Tistlia consotensis USBA 355]SNS30125.1 Methyltransferase domain-containing protein [Tistlia consotensis]
MRGPGGAAQRPEAGLPDPHPPRRRDYLERLAEIHVLLRPRAYLEIGVYRGASLRLAGPATLAVGVDPLPDYAPEAGGRVRIYRETSDAFFARPDPTEAFEGRPLDLVFIDGLHHFEAVLHDFVQAARLCAPTAWILLHDTLPQDQLMTARPRATQAWTGDVWKVVPCLREQCPSLRIATIDTAPTGLTLIGGIGPEARTLDARYDDLVERYAGLGFSWFEANGRSAANTLPDGPGVVEGLLSASGPASSASAPSM